MKLLGIHHITAIAGEPQQNLDFYAGLLGLRFVKRTVNFDDPSSYHFYFGDRTGKPGTAMTFFPWPGARRGTRGSGQVIATSFAVQSESIDYWKSRFAEHHVVYEEIAMRFGDRALRLADDVLRHKIVRIPEKTAGRKLPVATVPAASKEENADG